MLNSEEDAMVWQFTSSGVYSSHKLINFRGVQPVFVSAVWDIKVPPEFIFFFGSCLRIESLLGTTWGREGKLKMLLAYSVVNLS